MIRRVIRRPAVNAIARAMLTLLGAVGRGLRFRIPVFGIVTAKTNGLLLRLYCEDDDRIAITTFRDGLNDDERETLQLFLRLLPEVATVLDIGANTGLFALLAAIQNRQRAVYALEPVPNVYKRLVLNSQLNCTTNLQAINAVISDADGRTILHVPVGDMLPTEASMLSTFRRNIFAMDLETRSLDSFVKEHNINNVDLMKIDTEGTEHKVFAGARNVIRRWRPVIFCEVLNGITEEHLHAELDNADYSFFLDYEAGSHGENADLGRSHLCGSKLSFCSSRAGELHSRHFP